MFRSDILLPSVSVKGEISNLKYHSSGHIYFSLKDENSTISGVMFQSYASRMSLKLRDGMKVIVSGSIETYIRDGKYQIYAKKIEDAGIGDLSARFEELKRKLKAEGLFDENFKRPLPFYPRTVGVVTADTGAAIRDIISVSRRRNPFIQIILYPAQVQGEGAADTIVEGIRALEEYGVDLMIVGRGGGSVEDLWAFNEEKVAYAIFESEVPVISAVGHEVDFTIADFVADVRAATPSAAAELAIPEIEALTAEFEDLKDGLDLAISRKIVDMKHEVEILSARILKASPESRIATQRMMWNQYYNSLGYAIKGTIESRKNRQSILAERLAALSPLERLKGGLAYVSKDGKRVSEVSSLNVGENIVLTMRDGSLSAKVESINSTKE